MATEVISTIKSSGGDYISLNAWEAGEQGDLTGVRDEISIAECYSFSDTTAVSILGWTTSATQYIKIYTPTSERHDGKWNNSKYRLQVNGSDAIAIYEDYVTIEGLQIELTADSVNNLESIIVASANASNQITISHTIIVGIMTGTSALCSGIRPSDPDTNIDIINSIIYGFGTNLNYGLRLQGAVQNIYNSVITKCNRGGDRSAGTVTFTNCAIFNNTLDITGVMTVTYCAGDDFSGGTGNIQWTGGATDWNNNFTDYTNDDYSIVDNEADIYNAGTDLSGNGVTDDIIGTSRPQSSSYDIGAFEFIVAAAGNPQYYYAQQ